jgi:amino-acid N-acetyltransferase
MDDIDQILSITVSGVRPGEHTLIKTLISECGLTTEDITAEKLRHFLLARKGDEIVGVVGLEIAGKDALFRSLAVCEPYRRQGIGAKLTQAIERFALSQAVETLYLLTMTAELFFAGQGYARTDRNAVPAAMQATQEFQSLCPATAVCMRKPIPRKTTNSAESEN